MSKSILTVDDSPSMRMLLRAALCDLGYEVSEAEDGIDALEVLSHGKPDLMITDINM
ncbi:MAG: response regulator, partial [Novosphingopyxis baekryungensis]|nr:response regulator [Novosphingopyxis baekryungensis]